MKELCNETEKVYERVAKGDVVAPEQIKTEWNQAFSGIRNILDKAKNTDLRPTSEKEAIGAKKRINSFFYAGVRKLSSKIVSLHVQKAHIILTKFTISNQ